MPDALGFKLVLAAHVQRALRQQARRAFDVALDHGVALAKRAFPHPVIRAKQRDAGRSDVGGQVRQRAIGSNDQPIACQQRQGLIQQREGEKLRCAAQFFREHFPQAAPIQQIRDDDAATLFG